MTISFVVSVRPHGTTAPTGWIVMKFYTSIFQKSVEKIQVSFKSDTNNGQFTCRPINSFDQISPVLLYMRNITDRTCCENKNTYFMFSNFF